MRAYRRVNEDVAMNAVRSSCFRRGVRDFGEVLRARRLLGFVDFCCYKVY